jgi:hypothetical protein
VLRYTTEVQFVRAPLVWLARQSLAFFEVGFLASQSVGKPSAQRPRSWLRVETGFEEMRMLATFNEITLPRTGLRCGLQLLGSQTVF